MNHLKGNFIMSAVGIGFGLLSKKLFKKEIIPVSTSKQIFFSYIFILGVTIGGKITILKLYEKKIPPYSGDTKGHPKVENEGFIGPYSNDVYYLMHPNKWDKIEAIENWFSK